MNSWFRSWHGAPTDDKWLVVAGKCGQPVYAVSAFVWALYDHASQNKDRGLVSDFDFETYCAKSGMEEDAARKIYEALEVSPKDKPIIKNGQLANWEKRQPKREDSSTQRVRKFRETQCNADETQRNAPEKRREDTEKNREERIKTNFDEEFEKEFWPLAEKKKSVGLARKAYTAARAKAEKDQILKAWRTHNAEWKAKKNTKDWEFVPHPATWLNQERWSDEIEATQTQIDVTEWPEWKQRMSFLIGRNPTQSWFSDCVINGKTVTMKNKFQADYVRGNFIDAVHQVFGKEYEVVA